MKKILQTLLLYWIVSISAHPADLKVGVQLWSVKDQLISDFKGTIKSLATMGFAGVELAGEYGEFVDDPKGLANFLESQGLEINGAHTVFAELSDEKIDTTLSFFKDAGVPIVIIAWDDRAFSQDTVWQTIADLNRLQTKVESYGLRFGYHNHAEEFNAYRDTTLWDHIARSTPDSLILQLDVGWAVTAGVNPSDYVRKYPGRTVTTHFKTARIDNVNKSQRSIIGQDSLDWAELIQTNQLIGGTEWLVLEQEVYPDGITPLEAVRLSKTGLDKLIDPLAP